MMKLIYHSESAIKEGKMSNHKEVFSELEQRADHSTLARDI